jgi:hypothetical protein
MYPSESSERHIKEGDVMKTTRRFWPLDYDQEVEIYENLSWDLPGFKRFSKRSSAQGKPPGRKRTKA